MYSGHKRPLSAIEGVVASTEALTLADADEARKRLRAARFGTCSPPVTAGPVAAASAAAQAPAAPAHALAHAHAAAGGGAPAPHCPPAPGDGGVRAAPTPWLDDVGRAGARAAALLPPALTVSQSGAAVLATVAGGSGGTAAVAAAPGGAGWAPLPQRAHRSRGARAAAAATSSCCDTFMHA